MEVVRGKRIIADGAKLKNKPKPGRYCECGRKISRYNPNETCWEHAPIDYGRIRGRPYDKQS